MSLLVPKVIGSKTKGRCEPQSLPVHTHVLIKNKERERERERE
jgi:hypothetical protein